MLKFLFGNSRYLRFWTGAWFSQLGYWTRNMTLIFVVLALSHNSSKALSVNMLCEFAPTFLAPMFGVIADMWPRKRTIVLALAAQAILLFGISVAVSTGSLIFVYVGTLIGSIAGVLMSVSSMAFVSEIVDRNDRKHATSLAQLVSSALLLIGPALGTVIFNFMGGVHSLWISGFLYLVTLGMTASIRTVGTQSTKTSRQKKRFLSDLKGGLSYARQHPLMKGLLTVTVIIGLVAGIVNVLEVFLVTEFLGLPKTMLSILLSIQGGITLVSVPFLNRLKMSPERMLVYGVLLLGVGLCIMVTYPKFMIAVLGYGFVTVSNTGLSLATATILRTEVELEYQGRTMSLGYTVQSGVMAVMTAVTGWLHSIVSVQVLVLSSGGIALIGGICLYALRNRWFPAMLHNQPASIES